MNRKYNPTANWTLSILGFLVRKTFIYTPESTNLDLPMNHTAVCQHLHHKLKHCSTYLVLIFHLSRFDRKQNDSDGERWSTLIS